MTAHINHHHNFVVLYVLYNECSSSIDLIDKLSIQAINMESWMENIESYTKKVLKKWLLPLSENHTFNI